ncbi:MAG: AI-2E family transporter [Proteobacteria bacterium]|nr:AI-2E family transporter [Pseudomonadota bacterium]
MIELVSDWYKRHFSHPQAVLLVVLLVAGFILVIFFGDMLAPVLAALVIAYLLEGSVHYLETHGLSRIVAVTIVFTVFLTILAFLVVGLAPIVSRQLTNFVHDLPRMVSQWRELLVRLPETYPNSITTPQIDEVINTIRSEISALGQSALTLSLASIPVMVTVLVYLILAPVLVFFFLKDKDDLAAWLSEFLPKDRRVLVEVWHDVDDQIGNYVRGKVYEIFIVGSVTYASFALLGLSYAPMLAVLVGLSVIVPYIGAAVITLPVAVAAYIQFGWGADFIWIMVAYGIIQALDGNLLVPLLFSDVVNLHPVAIIVAVLVFGGLWGFWGVFFAIPLATLVKSLLKAWPSRVDIETAAI